MLISRLCESFGRGLDDNKFSGNLAEYVDKLPSLQILCAPLAAHTLVIPLERRERDDANGLACICTIVQIGAAEPLHGYRLCALLAATRFPRSWEHARRSQTSVTCLLSTRPPARLRCPFDGHITTALNRGNSVRAENLRSALIHRSHPF